MLKGMMVGACWLALLGCSKADKAGVTGAAPVLTAPEQKITQKMIEDEVADYKTYHFDLICHTEARPRHKDKRPSMAFLGLRLDGKGVDDAKKITDYDGLFVWNTLENGKLGGTMGSAFNVKFQKRIDHKGEGTQFTTWIFYLNSSGNPINYHLLIVDREASEESGTRIRARMNRSPLMPDVVDNNELLTCVHFNL